MEHKLGEKQLARLLSKIGVLREKTIHKIGKEEEKIGLASGEEVFEYMRQKRLTDGYTHGVKVSKNIGGDVITLSFIYKTDPEQEITIKFSLIDALGNY